MIESDDDGHIVTLPEIMPQQWDEHEIDPYTLFCRKCGRGLQDIVNDDDDAPCDPDG